MMSTRGLAAVSLFQEEIGHLLQDFWYVYSHEKRITRLDLTRLALDYFFYVKYKDLCATINPPHRRSRRSKTIQID